MPTKVVVTERTTHTPTAHHTVRTETSHVRTTGPSRTTTSSSYHRSSGGMANCGWLWSIVWVILLLIIGWPIGILCGILYAIVCAFVPCCGGCADLANFLHRGLELPKTCASNMVSQRSGC
ncbi:uncharacterized protein LOC117307186 [Asterias rubens]|uniref:uncharacterized protein LOC117307186 n=1 Tax=Asterias rubens TaxID=7604 RepID=UPI001455C3C7|nr:uncharacterized protein LOC117307186 [Asterias rubens]